MNRVKSYQFLETLLQLAKKDKRGNHGIKNTKKKLSKQYKIHENKDGGGDAMHIPRHLRS